MIRLRLFIILTLISLSGYCQEQLAGQVKDMFTTKAIKGARVKNLHTHAESISDSLGYFRIEGKIQDSLLAECKGYYSTKLVASKIDDLVIKLEDAFPIFSVVEESTHFPGGLPSFYDYVAANLRHPGRKKHGKIFVYFAVDTTGLIMRSETKILRAPNEKTPEEIHKLYDYELIRLVNESPAWVVARQRGKKVRQGLVLPINF